MLVWSRSSHRDDYLCLTAASWSEIFFDDLNHCDQKSLLSTTFEVNKDMSIPTVIGNLNFLDGRLPGKRQISLMVSVKFP